MKKYINLLININNIVIVSLIFSATVIFGAQQALAQEVPKQYLSVSPIIEDVTLIPGKPFSYTISISNHADHPLGIHIDLSPFDPDNLANPSQTSQSVLPWTIVSENDFIVPEKSKQSVTITLKPPQDAKDGGYYGAFVVTPFISQQQKSGTPIVLTRFIAVVFATLGKINYDNLAKKIIITNFKPVNYFIDNHNPFHLTFTVANNYFTHFTAKPFLTIKPLLGEPVSLMPDEKHIFPGRQRSWDISLQTFPTNRILYTANLAISIGNGEQVTQHTLFVIIPRYLIYILSLFIFALVLINLRKRLVKAAKILIRGK